MSDVGQWLESHQITLVECLVPDLNGLGKGKTVLATDLVDGVIKLPEGIFGQDITGKWSEDKSLINESDIDIVLAPVESTLVAQPWSAEHIAQCICDYQSPDGGPSDIAPRSILKQVLGLYDDLGLKPLVAQEAEFHVVANNPDPNQPLQPAIGLSGRQPNSPRSFQMEALNEYRPYLETLQKYSDTQNIELTGLIQEMGRGQLEVNFNHGDPLRKADEMFCFKRIARLAAIDCGFQATFLAKPLTGEPGSAMHLHQSLTDINSGENIFAGEDGAFSDKLYAFIGGLQKYTPYAMAILAPHENSYRRYAGKESCPTNIEWGVDNRTTGFRVPKSSPSATRVENRIPGSDTNPYLAIAVSLACGYLGLKENLKPSSPIEGSAWDQPRTLPASLSDSLQAFIGCEVFTELFGERFMKLYVDIKTREASAFAAEVTAWEREHLIAT